MAEKQQQPGCLTRIGMRLGLIKPQAQQTIVQKVLSFFSRLW